MAAKRWIDGDETAAEMLSRVSSERPFLLLPPLHRVPLRVGNVVELAGPSSSAKTQILIQAAVNCILPREWNGVHYGGLERLVMFIDLDCRFDILRLSEMLKHKIMEPNGSMHDHEELFAACMRRFMYVRCYDSLEFLATLKTLHHRLKREKAMHNVNIQLLMIDSIGPFHWVDRGSTFFPLGSHNRKCLSLQSISETVVQEIRKLLVLHPMLVIATKEIVLGNVYGTDGAKQNKYMLEASGIRSITSSSQQLPYREFMPPIWQSLITHKILVRASDDHLLIRPDQENSLYLSEWLLPSLGYQDKFVVKDAGIFVVS
ncbi:putative DNA repair protein XRCC2 [Rosa chinensis]|uniref:Putative DNA repair protein XRCC2 n=1 Tax=Rosa chinensis TaxID=74649 RepID=A0A2P6R4M1_ROSCH|nr:DNA repair protein XRCC2 homolog isoform X2 [Rosa chinensis]PRQ41387.1 putative DNA repair protein XRCC2 [Rosa chinensis]